MGRGLKIVVGIVAGIVVLGLVLGGLWFWFSRRALPETRGTVQVSGISGEVEILRDEFGVAHIYAQTPDDLFFAQGYVHAQERFWQMDFQRRAGAGRLSEVYGEASLGTDKYLRNFGFQELAEAAYDLADPETKRVLEAYAAGVNAYIADRSPAQLALEFGIVGLQGIKIDIEPWTPANSLIWGEMLIFNQSDRLRTELRNIDLLASVGNNMYSDMLPAYRDDRPVIVRTEELVNPPAPSAAVPYSFSEAELDYLLAVGEATGPAELASQALAAIGFGASGGSNSFVISGEKTATGLPLLANDPHMDIQAPSLWYEVGMHCVEKSPDCLYNFRGFSLPGVPGILIGHNDRIAWGLTNASFDAEDVFIERLNPENPNQYEVNGAWVDMEIRREEIFVQGREEPVVIFVRSTRNGVVATDHMVTDQPTFSYSAEGPEIFALSYAWTAFEPAQPVRAVMGVLKAQNWDEFVESLQYFDAGKQNWLYADVEGNIGYILPGKIPIRAGGDGSLPVPGWNDDYIWTGYIPYDELPRAFNPEKGYIATANNPQVLAAEYPYLISSSQDRGQRAQRLQDLIEGHQANFTVDDMVAIQTDNLSLSALEILPYIEDLSLAAETAAGRDRLMDWNAQMHMDSPEAAFFNMFWVHLLAETFHDQLPENLYPSGAHATSDTVYFLLQDENNVWWDDVGTDGEVENQDTILIRSLEAAYAEGVATFGDNFDEWRWGDLHTITYRNSVLGQAGITVIENLFNRGPYPTSGSESVIQKTCWSARTPYEVGCIPALRQVIDLSNLSNSRMVHNLGQSGHPMDPHYADFVDPWRLFDYHPSNWSRFDIEAREHDVLVLTP